MRLPTALASMLAVSVSVGALEPLNPPVPLAPPESAVSPGESAFSIASAQRAEDMGFASTAAALYRALLAAPGADAGRLTLALSTALLDDGDVAGAGRVLESCAGPRGSAWHLRAGLVAAYLQRTDQARSELAASRFDDLEPADRGWHLFLQGMLADASNEPARAGGFYQQAAASSVSELQRARFLLAEEQVRLRVGSVGDIQLEADRKNAETFQGQKIGYGFAREYAIALNARGRKQQAVDVLQNELRVLPAEERPESDHFRLLLGLIAGAGAGAGRHELFELLASGSDPDRQRIALQLLLRNSQSGALRAELGERLDRLIAEPRPHPVLESLLLYRAQLGLGDARYARAEADAHALIERFPGSPLKAHAYAVLASSAWEQYRYRTAADYAFKAGAEFPPGPIRAEFSMLVAEAWFRAGVIGGDPGDFRSAADAYAAALRSRPEGVRPGLLMFQRVQSEIEAGELAAAVAVLDDLARDPAFDAEDRWEAEWNLARSLEVHGRTPEAYDRVNRLLRAGPPALLRAELKARMAWLQARLSFDAKRPEETLALADSLSAATEGLAPDLKSEIVSTGALLRAQAYFELKRDQEAEDTLRGLRAGFPRSESTVYSYIVEADRFAQEDKVVDAQRLLQKLADDFPNSAYAPYALYQAALQAERLGTDKNLTEAYKLLYSLVNNPKYASSELIFPARMRQGDLLRELNQFPQAQHVYEYLVNNAAFARNPDAILAQLALAECHEAQSANNASHADSATRIFEDLVERVDAPADVRVEAGYNLGKILSRSDPAKAQAVWWGDVVDAFLVKPGGPRGLGPKGRWWIARTLLEVGSLYEQQGRVEEAKRAWLLVVDSGLPGDAIARERLARFHLPAAKG
ncbi:MAG TPA: tetratricopeptide repeat protein [Opitutaceae bacterium]|nr:tetratricopeptide repeat protein [Opitutaceae bacterium]